VLANDLNLSIRNPILVYSFLAMYGVLTVLILSYVHARFRVASKTLKMLQTEWTSAESKHASMIDVAQEQLSRLSTPAPAVMAAPVQMQLMRHAAVGFDTRNQVVTMAKRGMSICDIARNCGLHEGEVEVLLGMARLGKN
jgi:hypothetical protein